MLPILEQEAAERQKQGRGSDGSGGRGHKKNPTQKVEYGLDRNERTAAAEKLRGAEGPRIGILKKLSMAFQIATSARQQRKRRR